MGLGVPEPRMSLRDRVRNGAAYSVETGGLSGGGGPSPISQSPYDRYSAATRPQVAPTPRLRQRIAARGETPDVEYMGG